MHMHVQVYSRTNTRDHAIKEEQVYSGTAYLESSKDPEVVGDAIAEEKSRESRDDAEAQSRESRDSYASVRLSTGGWV